MQRIQKNDQVMVIAGKEVGKTGKVIALFPEEGKAVVEKLNLVKRHQKPTPKMRQGGIVEKELPLELSNLMPYCPKCSKGVRVRFGETKEGKKVRHCARCEEVL